MKILLDGRIVKNSILERLKSEISKRGFPPTLAIVQIGDRSESNSYIKNKISFGEKIGAKVLLYKFPENTTEDFVAEKIKELGSNKDISGIILQLPIPESFNKSKLINLIPQNKDVDGLTDENIKLLEKGNGGFIPATARGVIELLNFYNIDPKNKNVVVMGRSALAGGPIARSMKMLGANVSVIHKSTENPKNITQKADILIVAIGKPKYVDESFIKEGTVVVDVGINSINGERLDEEIPKKILVGDVDFESVKEKASAISPVPGGVGQMTVAALFENLFDTQ